MAVLFRLEVYTPYRLFFSDMVEAVSLSLIDGEAAIYANHAPFTGPVVPCIFKIKDKTGIWKPAFAAEGILEVTGHKTVVMLDAVEWPEEIDRDRASKAREKARNTLENGMLKFELDNAALSLKRAEYRLKVLELADKGISENTYPA